MVADEETQEGDSSGMGRDHERSVQHPECEVLGHMWTLCICTQKETQT